MKTIVIGAGAAGLMAAYSAARNGNKVVILEKNEKCGKKIYITGKGRCNLTNYCTKEDFIKNVVSNPKFLFSSLNRLDSFMTVDLFNEIGLYTKVERGNRVFPESDIASDVTRSLEKVLKKLGVSIVLNCNVKEIKTKDGRFDSVVTGNDEIFEGDACIVATGGMSYPSTGSTGDGYRFAKSFGHTIVDTVPSLVGLKTKETFVKELEGLSLRNVVLKVYVDGREKSSEIGEMLFTHNGVSGPLVLTASARFARDIAIGKKVELKIDMKPALDNEVLDSGLIKDFREQSNKAVKNVLGLRIPSSLIPVVLELVGIDGDKKANSITIAERKRIVEVLKNFKLNVLGSGSFLEAVVTQGGVKVSEINPATMESKLINKLYFAGEVLDLDAYTGGYNLQIAWTTGYTAGLLL